MAQILPPLIWSMWPLVKMSQGITHLLARGKGKYTVTREEIAAMADIGHREGIIDRGDSRIVSNLLRFDRLTVKDIMTPRTVLFALPQDLTVDKVLEQKERLHFTRIPVFDGSVDRVTGFVLTRDLLFEAIANGGTRKIGDLKRDLTVVPETMPLEKLFDTLLKHDRHIAIATDSFGGTAGVVTIEDVVETLLGLEIVDELDDVDDLQAHARQKWEERAAAKGLS